MLRSYHAILQNNSRDSSEAFATDLKKNLHLILLPDTFICQCIYTCHDFDSAHGSIKTFSASSKSCEVHLNERAWILTMRLNFKFLRGCESREPNHPLKWLQRSLHVSLAAIQTYRRHLWGMQKPSNTPLHQAVSENPSTTGPRLSCH